MTNITMKDIAEQAGISRQTVSDILNKKNAIKVSEKTREKVWKLVKEKNYRPNYLSQSLKKGKTDIICVATMSGTFGMFGHYYTSKLLHGIGLSLYDSEYKMLFQNFNRPQHMPQMIDLLNSRLVDGVIIILYSNLIDEFKEVQLPLLKKAGIPFVAVHSTTEDMDCHNAGVDITDGVSEAVRHLADHGYRSIGMVGPVTSVYHEQDMIEGYGRAMESLPCENILLPPVGAPIDNRSLDSGYDWADRILNRGAHLPRALFVVEDVIANGIIKRFRQAGIRTPEDVAIITYGDEENEVSVFNEVTVLAQPATAKGEAAGALMQRVLDKRENINGPVQEILKPELVVRKSCGC